MLKVFSTSLSHKIGTEVVMGETDIDKELKILARYLGARDGRNDLHLCEKIVRRLYNYHKNITEVKKLVKMY